MTEVNMGMEAVLAVLTVMTFNVNLGLSGDPETLRAIQQGKADVVFLQETTPGWEQAIRKRLGKTYPHMEFHHCCRAGGLAVLSRYPLKEHEIIEAPTGWFPAQRVVVATPTSHLQVLNVHLRPPISDSGSWLKGYFTTGGDRLKELKHYMTRMKKAVPSLVVGDFNEQKGDSLEHLFDLGWRNALYEEAPKAHTWRWTTSLGELKQALDHVYFDARIKTLGARVLKLGRSDHMPVLVRLAFTQ